MKEHGSEAPHARATTETTLTTEQRGKSIIGVLGGMGPLASAEFVRTIYSYHRRGPEQDAPVVMLYSDPTFPDRTEALLRGANDLLLERLIESLTRLCELGASELVICCVTSHYLLPRVPPRLRQKIISLVDVIFDGVLRAEKRHLLLCTEGTRRAGLFENHRRWDEARDLIVLPRQCDQSEIHQLIYRLKGNAEIDELLPLVGALLKKYEVDSFIVGCTELHLVTRRLAAANITAYGYVDPLTLIAEDFAQARS